jgi:ribosomal protein S18 acetylase RimI-like enzyme
MSKLHVSAADDEDISTVAGILTEATRYKLSLGDTAWGNVGWNQEEVRKTMNKSLVYLIRIDKEIIGTVSLQWDDQRIWGNQLPLAGYIHRLAIKNGFHGKNIGKQVIDWAEAHVAENGRTLLRLDCPARNISLCSYYESLGFQQVSKLAIPEYGDYFAALYEKRIVLT